MDFDVAIVGTSRFGSDRSQNNAVPRVLVNIALFVIYKQIVFAVKTYMITKQLLRKTYMPFTGVN